MFFLILFVGLEVFLDFDVGASVVRSLVLIHHHQGLGLGLGLGVTVTMLMIVIVIVMIMINCVLCAVYGTISLASIDYRHQYHQ